MPESSRVEKRHLRGRRVTVGETRGINRREPIDGPAEDPAKLPVDAPLLELVSVRRARDRARPEAVASAMGDFPSDIHMCPAQIVRNHPEGTTGGPRPNPRSEVVLPIPARRHGHADVQDGRAALEAAQGCGDAPNEFLFRRKDRPANPSVANMQPVLTVDEDRDHPAGTELARALPFTPERPEESPRLVPQRNGVPESGRARRIEAAPPVAPDYETRIRS